MMKLFIDECIPNDLNLALNEARFDVLTVQEAGLQGKGDEDVFLYAKKSKRVLMTFDRGFGDIFRFQIAKSYGVVIILVARMTKAEMLTIPILFLSKLEKDGLKGKLTIIGKTKIRVMDR